MVESVGAGTDSALQGHSIRCVRILNHFAGPFKSEQELNEYLIGASRAGGFPSEYNDALMSSQIWLFSITLY